jgi:hypothetical protein
VGPAAAVAGFERLLADDCAGLSFTVNRLDLFSDWQGWALDRIHRDRFACKAGAVRTFEDGGSFTGFEFGSRTTKTLSARLYDKTAEVARSGADWWPAIWGERYRPGVPVHRVEFEVGRQGLAEFGLDSPAQVLAGAGDLWRYATHDWLTYRLPATGANRSRRPLAPEWLSIQRASLCGSPIGLERITAGRRAGSIRRLFPGLAGYLATFAAVVGTAGIDDTLVALDGQLREDELGRHVPFPERIRRRREELTAR